QFERLESLFGIRQRVAGAGNAEHRHLWNRGSDSQHLLRGLFRRQLLTDDTGPRFVGAVVLAVAVVALNIAGRGHRNMHARIVMVSLFAVAGMVLDLLPNLGGEIVLTRTGAATGLAAAAMSAAPFVLGNLLHDLWWWLNHRQT